MKLDAVRMLAEPFLSFLVEVVARAVVGDQEDLPGWMKRDDLLEEDQVGLGVEDLGELKREAGVVDGNRSVDMRGLPQAKGGDARLLAYSSPGSMERSVEPKAGLVFEEDLAAAARGFFFNAGKVTRSQVSCFSASARARSLRGRCTEKPNR